MAVLERVQGGGRGSVSAGACQGSALSDPQRDAAWGDHHDCSTAWDFGVCSDLGEGWVLLALLAVPSRPP